MKAVIFVTLTFFATCKKNVDQLNDVNHVKNGIFTGSKEWNLGLGWKVIDGKAMFHPIIDKEYNTAKLNLGLSQRINLTEDGYILFYDVEFIEGELTVFYDNDTVFHQDYRGDMVKPFMVDSAGGNELVFIATGMVVLDNVEIRNW